MNGLMLHCGALAASLDQIDAVTTPRPTETHYPIPHGQLIRQVRSQLLDAGAPSRRKPTGSPTTAPGSSAS